jgi:chromosome segregation protein
LRIKKLELLGFKSFKDRTVIQFDEGITGIVGPNGCGKSNIVDALVWVMGEMSAKHLRGSSMEDVIFAGAEGYAPMGMAEVSLTLENDGGPFPVKYLKHSEIMVTRRLHRSGESEYLINKEPARLRDVQEIFMDTGAGSKGFSIVEQGAIGRIVTAKPDDRRSLIEEAAGITKFKARKRESQRKLQATETNLMRLQDIISELKRQMDSLQRQAQRAERYRKLKREVEDLELWTSSVQYLAYQQEISVLSEELQKAENELIALQSSMGTEDSDIEEKRSRLMIQEKQVMEWQQKVQAEQLRAREQENEVQERKFEIERARHRKEMTGSLIQENELRKKLLQEELQKVADRLEAIKAKMTEVQGIYDARRTELEQISTGYNETDNKLTNSRRELLTVSQAASSLEARALNLQESVRQIAEELIEKRQEREDLLAEHKKLDKNRTKVLNELESEKQLHLDLSQGFEALSASKADLEKQVQERRAEADSTKEALNEVTSRLYGLEGLRDNMEGFQEGVRSVMFWQKQQLENEGENAQPRLRPLAEAVEVPKDYELAMEAALGPRLQLLLSEEKEVALEAVEFLKTQNKGRSSFYTPSMMAGGMEMSSSSPSGDGVLAELSQVVQCEPKDKPLLQRLLNNVAVVDSITTALNLKPNYPEWTFVTPHGDLLSTEGVLTAGASDSVDSGVLKRRREIKALSEQKQELAGKHALQVEVLKKMTAELEGLVAELNLSQRKTTEQEIILAGLRKDHERAQQECENALNALKRHDSLIADLEQREMSRKAELQSVEDQLSELRSRREELTASIETLQGELEEMRGKVQASQNEVTQLRVEAATRTQEYEGVRREHEMIEKSFKDVEAQLSKMVVESTQSNEDISTHQVVMEEKKIELERTLRNIEIYQERVAELRNSYEELQAEVRAIEEQVHAKRKNESQLQAKVNADQLKLEQVRMKVNYLQDQMEERYQVRLEEVAHKYADREGDPKDSEEILKDLKGKLAKIGEVNLSAIEDYDGTVQRYEFLKAQQDDLLDAKEQLKKVIDRIQRICSRRFKETFDAVNERFQRVFPVLFGGGEAQLILIEDEEKGEMGIDIVAKPPGKKSQNVSLLSGGEKALTAVSLIFSIFLVSLHPTVCWTRWMRLWMTRTFYGLMTL